MGVGVVEVSLELAVAEFVGGFVFSVVVPLFLDCVVGEMNKFIGEIFQVVAF